MSESKKSRFSPFDRLVAMAAIAVTLALILLALSPPWLSGAPEAVRFFGRLHPMVVHLPIGFLLALFVLEALDLCVRSAVLHHATYVMAWLAAFASVFAVVAGVILAVPGGYGEELLFRHRWLGVLTGVCSVWILAWKVSRSPREPHGWSFAYHPLLLATAILLTGAGHYGGSLTHGSDYLTAYMPDTLRSLLGIPERVPAAPPLADAPDDLRDAMVFADIVQPILQANCVGCHGPERQRNGLRLDSYELLMEGGESGPDPGLIAESLRLPLDDDRRMPPRERPQLSEEEIALITWWVRTGAGEGERVRDVPTTAQIDRILEARSSRAWGGAGDETEPMNEWEVIEESVDRLGDELGVGIRRVARDSAAVEIPFIAPGAGFGDAELERLAPIAPNLETLNLGRTEVTDEGLAHVAAMTNLVRLDLSNTAVTDAGLVHLADLPRLHFLNLYGAGVTDEGIRLLETLPSLRQVYLWRTAVTEEGAERLRRSLLDELAIDSWRDEIRELERRIASADVEIDIGQTHAGASADAGAEPVNEDCPVSGEPVDAAHTVVHDDELIAFCCANCLERFEEDPSSFLAEIERATGAD